MTSVQRTFMQRNNNISQIIPTFVDILPNIDSSGSTALYNLNINNLQFKNGIYYVDMSDVDSSGNLLNVDGVFYPLVPEGNTLTPINIITFALNFQVSASNYPGLEITIFFKNIPIDRLTNAPFLTIGINSIIDNQIPIPYIVSPPFPNLVGPGISPSITLKSDGTNFNVVSSGPAGWLGVPALSVILAAYSNLNPV